MMFCNIAFFLLECVKLLLVLCGILNLKYKRKAPGAWCILLMSVICLVIKGVQDSEYRISTFSCIAVVICALMIEAKRRFLLTMVCYMGICCVDELIAFVAQTVFSVSDDLINGNQVLFIILNSISAILFATIALLMVRLCKKRFQIHEIVQNISVVHLILCMLGTLAITFMTSVIGNEKMEWNEKQIQLIAGGSCVFGCVFVLLWLLFLYNSNSRNTYKKIAEINKRLLEAQERYYRALLENENETRRFRHDITNHLLCLDVLLKEKDYKEAEEYLEVLKGNLQDLGSGVQTGNRLVNAILNDISQKYSDVTFIWNGALPQKMSLCNADICTIFSNTLENAFYAASSCEQEKTVEVMVQEIGQGVKVMVKNNMSRPIEMKEGRFITGKADKKNHGFGILNVGECIKRNGGHVEYSYTSDCFKTKIILVNAL